MWFVKHPHFKYLLAALLFLLLYVLIEQRGPFGTLDLLFMDRIERRLLERGIGPEISDEICYLTITDQSYAYFRKSYLPREALAEAQNLMVRYGARAVIYDLIFSYNQNPSADLAFAKALRNSRIPSFLPLGFSLKASADHTDKNMPLQGAEPNNKELQKVSHLQQKWSLPNKILSTRGTHHLRFPGVAKRFFPELAFLEAATGFGHVGAPADDDGVYRHYQLLIEDHGEFVPALTLQAFMFLNRLREPRVLLAPNPVLQIASPSRLDPLASGETPVKNPIHIPSIKIPMDEYGRMPLPMPGLFETTFEKIALHKLLEFAKDPAYEGNLRDLLEGRIVLVGDISTGIADAASTSLENDVPLVALHAVALNAFLTGNFVRDASAQELYLSTGLVFLLLLLLSHLKKQRYLYITTLLLCLALPLGSVLLFYFHYRFPVITLGEFSFALFLFLLITGELRRFSENASIRRENERIHQEMELAAQIQYEILPAALPHNESLQVEAFFRPARFIGGDFYDCLDLGNGLFCLTLGDVSGKGVAAALFMSGAVGSLRSLLLPRVSDSKVPNLRQIVLELNKLLLYNSRKRKKVIFITAAFVLIDTKSGQCEFVRCGHEPFLLEDEAGAFRELQPGGLVLGVFDPSAFESRLKSESLVLAPGSTLYLYSDGLTEARNASNELFGLARIKEQLRSTQKTDPGQRLALLMAEMDRFQNPDKQFDDLSILAIRYG